MSNLCYLQPVTNFYKTCFRNCSSVYSGFCTLMVHFLWSKSSLILLCVILIVLYGALNIKPNKGLFYLPVQSCHFFSFFFHSILETYISSKYAPTNYLSKWISFNMTSHILKFGHREFFAICPHSSTWIVHLQLCSFHELVLNALAYFFSTLKSSIYPSRTC